MTDGGNRGSEADHESASDEASDDDRPAWTDETPPELTEQGDPETTVRRIRERGEAIKREELATALSRLRATGEFSAEQEAVVAEMADDIVAALLAPPATALSADADEATIETAMSLFDPEE